MPTMSQLTARIRIDASLHDLLPGRRRHDELTVPADGVATDTLVAGAGG
jgi:hypothetical protein